MLLHMAEPDTWNSIRQHGLLSTSRLLSLFDVKGQERFDIEAKRRPVSVSIAHPKYGRAVIRDQKPLIQSKLVKTLEGCTAEEWYRLLNRRVFFWLTKDRLDTLLCANTYAGNNHTVLTLDTLSLVKAHEERITLSHMNTGNTRPFAHPRGPDTFKKLEEYPFAERAKRGPNDRVVELVVEGGVTDIERYLLKVDVMRCQGGQGRVLRTIFKR